MCWHDKLTNIQQNKLRIDASMIYKLKQSLDGILTFMDVLHFRISNSLFTVLMFRTFEYGFINILQYSRNLF